MQKPGWYEDPQDIFRLRLWDGHQWTDQTAPKPAQLNERELPPQGSPVLGVPPPSPAQPPASDISLVSTSHIEFVLLGLVAVILVLFLIFNPSSIETQGKIENWVEENPEILSEMKELQDIFVTVEAFDGKVNRKVYLTQCKRAAEWGREADIRYQPPIAEWGSLMKELEESSSLCLRGDSRATSAVLKRAEEKMDIVINKLSPT